MSKAKPEHDDRKTAKSGKDADLPEPVADVSGKRWWQRHLPLETETCFFILANALDAIMTRLLLNFPQFRESNVLADTILDMYGMKGMIAFKFIIVAVVVLIAQFIAPRKLYVARYLLIGGTVFVFGVVVYSCYLWVAHSGYFFETGGSLPSPGK